MYVDMLHLKPILSQPNDIRNTLKKTTKIRLPPKNFSNYFVSNLLTFNVPDEGYFINGSCTYTTFDIR
jgi:hypothetical protein